MHVPRPGPRKIFILFHNSTIVRSLQIPPDRLVDDDAGEIGESSASNVIPNAISVCRDQQPLHAVCCKGKSVLFGVGQTARVCSLAVACSIAGRFPSETLCLLRLPVASTLDTVLELSLELFFGVSL